MIPSVVARQTRETILDYLRTTFALADQAFEDELFAFLGSDEGLFRGPYLDVRLPFRKAAADERIPLDVKPPFEPWQHQLKAFRRLYSKDGHQPQHTLVTTGTGSGKTESFLYPILDHCWRNQGQPGVKAIILYPMNALASDQARRLASLLWDDERLRGKVTAGLYVGGAGQHGAADRNHVVDRREVLRDSPPDILLTNYRMLDFLLLRPEDARMWKQNSPDTLRYLVLDELHTYDGAQGSDVACLIRRLKRRLSAGAGTVCCVGTSATIGSRMRGATVKFLTDFATKVFDEDFFEDSVITEERLDVVETLGDDVDIQRFPGEDEREDLRPDDERFADSEAWLKRQAELWLGEDAGGIAPVELGRRLARHDFLRQLLKVLDGGLKSWSGCDDGLANRVPAWEALGAADRQAALESFLALVSMAKAPAPSPEEPDRAEPFLVVQVQLWLRELHHLVGAVEALPGRPRFVWADDGVLPGGDERRKHLPLAYCRECGASGLASFQREGEQELQADLTAIGRSWLQRSRASRFVAFGHHTVPDDMLPAEYLCPGCLRLQPGETCDQCKAEDGEKGAARTAPVRVARDQSTQTPPRFLARCPDCGTEAALSMLGSRAASLLSVAISHLFQSDFNWDKKLLAFTDSVQDASHRAGFFGARTYRFNLRTAMQSVIETAPDGLNLDGFADALWAYWRERKPARDLIPTLLPSDLRELDTYKTFVDRKGEGRHHRLESDLQMRLSWEAVIEFGLNSRVGRTLEGTLCATVELDPAALGDAADRLALELSENPVFEPDQPGSRSRADLEHFLAGLLRRVRLRGGIDHPLLRSYIREGGNSYLLSKRKQPLMSPFSRNSVLPRFLTDRDRTTGDSPVFDSLRSPAKAPYTWHRDWASRALGVHIQDAGINDLYRKAVEQLEAVGLLRKHELSRGASAWGLSPARLRPTAEVSELRCHTCRRQVIVGTGEEPNWAGKRCPQYRCPGILEPAKERVQSYYGRIYRSGRLQRIFAEEHTGLLSREARERIEELFKAGTAPGAPNLFVCTPTLELGIDIGDLSAATLCSVPPTTANYLQRVGRTGRTTGNAFCLTVANSRPHDLYFHSEPMEMMAGQVLPPGCFLDAPEMLQRQIVAHAMDAWARQETQVTRLPRNAGLLLGEVGRRQFPGRFLEFYRERGPELFEAFVSSFEGYLSVHNRERLREFALGGSVPEVLNRAFDRLKEEIEELRGFQRRTRERLRQIEQDPETSTDPDVEKRELEDTRHMLGRLVTELRNKYPLNVLTDEGVLPNYAFPEPGVRLESVVAGPRTNGKVEYVPREYLRPASTAIRELAPFNTFYAEGRKVRIDEVDIGSRARPLIEAWRLCAECSYAEREVGGQPGSHCPRCRDVNWADAGQLRMLVHFRRSRSLASRLEASTVDDSDDREAEFYQTLDLIDVGPQHQNGAKLIEELPFGIELLKNLTLREVNFGLDRRAGLQGFRVRGEPISEKGFVVCRECGRVQQPGGDINHNAYCKGRRPDAPQTTESILLYREIQSEAIRVLLPVSEIRLEETRASFKAALQLGFRRHFQGDPGHLLIKFAREPIPGGYGVRQYLIVFDGVPGGTGYLSELWHGDHFLGVLAQALEVLQACRCQRDPSRDGCYRCLYAYQSQRDLKIISSRLAQNLLKRILDKRDQWGAVQTLSGVGLDARLESELEAKFVNALKDRVERVSPANWEERIQAGEVQYRARVGGVTWEIRSQIPLGSSQGVSPSTRPDFLFRCLDKPDVEPIAVYCDGLAYHACPDEATGRTGDDIVKRRAVIDSGRFHVWSVTWKDVEAFENKQNVGPESSIFRELHGNRVGRMAQRVGLTLDWHEAKRGSMETLLAFMATPDRTEWRKLAQVCALDVVGRGYTDGGTAAVVESQARTEPARFDIGPVPVAGSQEAVIGRIQAAPWNVVIANARTADLRSGSVDGVSVVIRLFDEAAARVDQRFEDSWRSALEAWNVFQFLDGVVVLSSECLPEFAEESATEFTAQQAAESGSPYDAAQLPAEFGEVIELATEASRPVIRAVATAGLPAPELDFELALDDARCGPQADVAWPPQRIALLAASQAPDRPAFEKAGWKVFEYPADGPEVVAAIRSAAAASQGSSDVGRA